MPNDVVFNHNGPDIVASARGITWKFECKGFGTGKNSTHKNHFDRAIASAVSYFDSPDTRLGLALADDYFGDHAFTDRLPRALRVATSLYVFRVVVSGEVQVYQPEDEHFPYSWARR